MNRPTPQFRAQLKFHFREHDESRRRWFEFGADGHRKAPMQMQGVKFMQTLGMWHASAARFVAGDETEVDCVALCPEAISAAVMPGAVFELWDVGFFAEGRVIERCAEGWPAADGHPAAMLAWRHSEEVSDYVEPEVLPLKESFLQEGGFWNDALAGFCDRYRGQPLQAQSSPPGILSDVCLHLPELMPPRGAVPPSIRPAHILQYLESMQRAEEIQKRTVAWVRQVTGQKANAIGHADNFHLELFLTEAGRMIGVFDSSHTLEWLNVDGCWEGGFLAFLRGDEPVALGCGGVFIME